MATAVTHQPEWVGGLTQLTKLVVTTKQDIIEFPRCILELRQLKELKLYMVELQMEVVQIASWQHLARIEVGPGDEFAHCYRTILGSWETVMLGESKRCAEALKIALCSKKIHLHLQLEKPPEFCLLAYLQ